MAKEVLCPICGEAYNLADEQLGKKVRCRKCEHAFTAGGEQRRRLDEDDEDEVPRRKSRSRKGRASDDDYDDRPRKTKSLEEQAKPRGQDEPKLPVSSFVIAAVVLGVLFVGCAGLGLAWLVWPSPRPNQPVNNPPPANQPFRQPGRR
jgi:predicted Zn finger-like uncharacterized protein